MKSEVEKDRIRVEIDKRQRDMLLLDKAMRYSRRHIENLQDALAEAQEHDRILLVRYNISIDKVNKLLDEMEVNHDSQSAK